MTQITAESISTFLETRDDFDLELFAFRTLNDGSGWLAHHGGTYSDPVTAKIRQYDVRAVAQPNLQCVVSLAVECKSLSPEFPLVVSRVPRQEIDSYHDVLRCWRPADAARKSVAVESSTPGDLRMYGTSEMVGKSLTQIRWDKAGGGRWVTSDADTHDKWSQAMASAADFIDTGARTTAKDGSETYTFVLPVLLVSDSTLWTVDYDESGRRSEPQRAEHATVFMGREYPLPGEQDLVYRISHLHICTRSGFPQLAKSLSTTGMPLERVFGFIYRRQGRR
jgi:hypothetical protein